MQSNYCHVSAQTERHLDEQSALEIQREKEDAEIQKMIESDEFMDHIYHSDLEDDMDELFQNCLTGGYKKDDWQKFQDKLCEYLRPIANNNLSE